MREKSLVIGLGLAVILIGILIEIVLRYQYWSNKPPFSTGPILVATVGLMYIVPLGLVILAYGVIQNKT
ncbi:MAG: hypothetical protein ACFFBJ_03490 [Promethearchaeota archaeon]